MSDSVSCVSGLRTTVIALLCVVSMSACTRAATNGSTSTTDATATQDTNTQDTATQGTAPGAPTTTEPLMPPPTGETRVECDAKAISTSYGEKVKVETCTATWAVGDTDRDTWNCPDEGCRDTRLYQLRDGKWTDTAICLRELPLTRWRSSCYIPNVGLATIDRIPPRDVACILWPANSLPRFAPETGCPLDEQTVLSSLREKCDGYFESFSLPLVKCNRGDLVRRAQVKLRALGYVRNVDIYFGTEMALGVHRFQKDNSLTPTGILDDDTWERLAP